MAETLERAAQVARVVQVANTCQAKACIFVWFARLIPFLNDFNTLALLLVETQVCRLALTTAVVDLVALAVKGEFAKLVAVAALRVDCQSDSLTF